jgi:hypothetical protein
MRTTSIARSLAPLAALGLALGGCAVATEGNDPGADENAIDNELTSNTALSRTLNFQGYVYVETTASDSSILTTIRHQTQSAFGALREANVGVNSRELKDVDASTFVKTKVTVVDTTSTTAPARPMLKVSYKYTDSALVPKSMARRSSLSLGLLQGNYQWQSDRILKECTNGDAHAQEFQSSIWYVFDPSLTNCKTAMATEQKAVDADKKKLKDQKTQVSKSEVDRLYIPVTMKLSGDKTNKGQSYPEYDRLYAGGVQKGKVVISMVNGLMADWAAGEKHDTIDDEGYGMWFEGLREIFKVRPGLKLVKSEPAEDFNTFMVGTTKVTAASFNDLVAWELDSKLPAGITSATQRDLRNAVATKVLKHWLTFEVPVKVKIGAAAEQTVIIQLNTYFGAETDSTPHKRGIKNSDIFVYNGHSYIGYGPLDPTNFRASDFPASYQILFINGCVSYNYYEKDYWALKSGGTRNLELVTNGLESWVNGSGPAMGRFVGSLIDGKQNSYTTVLTAAQFEGYGYAWGQDALRVVDGELDNVYTPAKTPIVVSN